MCKRIGILATAIAVTFFSLCFRLLDIGKTPLYAVAPEYATARQMLAASRGTIYDRYGQPLVNVCEEWVVSMAPTGEGIQVLSENVSREICESAMQRLSKGERAIFRTKEALPYAKGMMQIKAPVRYSERPYACHLIGYVDGSGMGVTGIEKACNEQLCLWNGTAEVIYAVDAHGRTSIDGDEMIITDLERSNGGVYLTIDATIQRIVENVAVDKMDRGAVIVLSAQNAQILAAASLPFYDPNKVEMFLQDPTSPLLDRTMINYNLGSVFKVITAAAALENGFDEQTRYSCSGAVEVNGTVFHCHNRLGDGEQTMIQAMANSCNCYFIQLAMDVGMRPIWNMAYAAGMSESIELMKGILTARGIMPSTTNLTAKAALANFVIGQGEVTATPYHIAALYKAIADDGVWRTPSIYLGEADEHGTLTTSRTETAEKRLFSKSTARKLRAMLKAVITDGTGMSAAPKNGEAFGKTGTAETGWVIEGETVVQSWFAGCYPEKHPQYVIVVLSENGGKTNKKASVIFADVCNELFRAGLVNE